MNFSVFHSTFQFGYLLAIKQEQITMSIWVEFKPNSSVS